MTTESPETSDPQSLDVADTHITIDAMTWGTVTATNNALAGPLLLSHGAGSAAFGIYASAISLFGLCTALLGLRLATILGSGSAALLLIVTGRLLFLLLPLVLYLYAAAPSWLLIGLLIAWAAAEGIAQPLWLAHLAGKSEPLRRGSWMARRAATAAGAGTLILVPALLLLATSSTANALLAAYGMAAMLGLVGLWSVRALSRDAIARPSSPGLRRPAGIDTGFLLAVLVFWFGAAFNRPVLPAYVSRDLGAPAAYFAAAAILAGLSGLLMQRRWGRCADQHGTRRLLLLTGVGAGFVPWIWLIAPAWWFGIPIEMIAAGCWLGHLLGLMLRCMELSPEGEDRPAIMAWTQMAQGAGAATGPLVAAATAGVLGTRPVLFISGALCLLATGHMAGGITRAAITASAQQILADTRRRIGFGVPLPEISPYPAVAASLVVAPAIGRTRSRRMSADAISLRRILLADCQSCAGLGCSTCLGTGLT